MTLLCGPAEMGQVPKLAEGSAQGSGRFVAGKADQAYMVTAHGEQGSFDASMATRCVKLLRGVVV